MKNEEENVLTPEEKKTQEELWYKKLKLMGISASEPPREPRSPEWLRVAAFILLALLFFAAVGYMIVTSATIRKMLAPPVPAAGPGITRALLFL